MVNHLFTIAFIGHNEFELMRQTIPQTLYALTKNTTEPFDTILLLDGVNYQCAVDIIPEAMSWGIDEIRIRSRHRNVAGGDPSNNGHWHMVTDKTRYLITIESDVAVFRTDEDSDVLRYIRLSHESVGDVPILFRIDDFQCWVEPLVIAAAAFNDDISSINRISTHFLMYDMQVFRKYVPNFRNLELWDDGRTSFNFEDFLSQSFAKPKGPGIGYLNNAPFRVFHCDRKQFPGSLHYSKSAAVKMGEFRRRRQQMQSGSSTENVCIPVPSNNILPNKV